MLLTSLIFAELVELYTVQGERPPAISGTGIVAALPPVG